MLRFHSLQHNIISQCGEGKKHLCMHLHFYVILPVSYLHRFTVQTHEGEPVSEQERSVITWLHLMPMIHEPG